MAKRLFCVAGWVVVAALGVLGLVTATAAVVTVAIIGAALGAGAGHALAARTGSPRTSVMVRSAAAGAAGMCAVAGLVDVMGAAAVPAVALAAAAVAWRRRNGMPEEPGTDLRRLSDVELGRAWQRSHSRVRAARTADELGRAATLRRHQLDEIERRDAAGCHAWLASGAWAGDSVPFLGT